MGKVNFNLELRTTEILFYFLKNIARNEHFFPSHISMYLSIFQYWCFNHYQNPFRIYRDDIMKLSKIKSIATYHKCIKELQDAGLIVYSPSYDFYKGSSISLISIESFQKSKRNEHNKTKSEAHKEIWFTIPMINEVELYFYERNFHSDEANKFYSFYQSTDWKLSNKKHMKSWQSAARNWISGLKNR